MTSNSIDAKIAIAERRAVAAKEALKKAQEAKRRLELRKLAPLMRSERTEDTRRKILIGAAVMAKMARGEMQQETLDRLMDAALTRPDDRALFELPALTQEPHGERAAT